MCSSCRGVISGSRGICASGRAARARCCTMGSRASAAGSSSWPRDDASTHRNVRHAIMPPRIVPLEEIERSLDYPRLFDEIAAGFAAYSAGDVIVPPVGHLSFADPRGDVHIKYGYIRGDSVYVIKIASGFDDNRSEEHTSELQSHVNLV